MLAGIVYAVFGIAELIVALRFLFLLFGASPMSQFVTWIYNISTPLVAPFANIFGRHTVIAGPGVAAQSTFEWTSLIALVVYAIVGGIIGRLLSSA